MLNTFLKISGLSCLMLSTAGIAAEQTLRQTPQLTAPAAAVVPQRAAAPRALPSVVNVPAFQVTGTALQLPQAVTVPGFNVTGTMLKLPVAVNVPAFDVTGSMLKLPVNVAVPPFAVTGTYKP